MSPADEPIEAWHVVISGFLQHQGQPTGMVRLWRRLHSLVSDRRTRVELRSWSDCSDTLAELIWRLRPDRSPPVVKIYGYSWGGAAALQLCRQLQRRGLSVAHLMLCDAVYRHRYWLGNWRALVGFSRLVVPANVRRVSWWRQKVELPCGHDVVAADPRLTQVDREHRVTDTGHVYMDDHDGFHLAAEEVAASVL